MIKLKRVLVVDDDEVSRFVTTVILKQIGCFESILTASHGREAFEMLLKDCSAETVAACWLDLILLDINMPIMDGFEFLRAHKEKEFRCAPKIVLLSSSSHPKDLEIARDFNLAGFLTKPLTEEALSKVLEKNFNCSCDEKVNN
jgi:CheY-like chemotaxis protein